ncbi:conserved membrane domain protein [Mycobacterium ulcerans str. Harvey]|uniref:Conserved membrane domain protein n=1 Tax=Mycobacterium ulcerans str. Harvey TaxID=1299332 RepID=A0ABN0R9S8_MYCUL|nr:conserved membrane domain protein [Mycobacterium ulcerans str. Harvey]
MGRDVGVAIDIDSTSPDSSRRPDAVELVGGDAHDEADRGRGGPGAFRARVDPAPASETAAASWSAAWADAATTICSDPLVMMSRL